MLNQSGPFKVRLGDLSWTVGDKIMNSVRIIDWGYAKSDHAFGVGDVASCMAIDMDRRVRYTRGLLFPSEFHDMASVLCELLGRVESLSEPDRLHRMLH
jgi:hypothetical protein